MKRTRIKPVSAKRRSQAKARQELIRAVMERDQYACQARIEGCSSHAVDVHELKSRARGGSILEMSNCIALCRPCHSFITQEPRWSSTWGFSLHATAGEAEYRAAERQRQRWLYGEDVVGDEQDS